MRAQKEITIYDIAKEAGVSPATVSRVINHYDQVTYKTRQKVIAAMNTLSFDLENYRVHTNSKTENRVVRKKNEQQLFVLSVPHLSNVFYLDIIDGAQTAALKNGHHLLINNTPIRELNSDIFLSTLKAHGVAGLITTETIPAQELEKIASLFPIVQCSEYNDQVDNISYIAVDNIAAAYQSTRFFTRQGYKRIAFFTIETPQLFSNLRKRGYMMALSEAHIPFDPQFVKTFPDMDLNRSIQQAEIFLQTFSPEAIVCISDIYASATIRAAKNLKIHVPGQLSIIGMDDLPIAAASTPSISTIRQYRYEIGYASFECLLEEYLHPAAKKRHVFLDTELVLRESTLPARTDT